MSALVDFARATIEAIPNTNAGVRFRGIRPAMRGVAVDVHLAAPTQKGSGGFERHG
jgi:hypothetical protein